MSETGVPTRLYIYCPQCDDDTLHEVVSVKGGQKAKGQAVEKNRTADIECKVLCLECEMTSIQTIAISKEIDLNVIISEGANSRASTIRVAEDDILHVEQELLIEDNPVMITGIETPQRRVQRAEAKTIKTLWVKEFEIVTLKISVSRAGRTKNYTMEMDPHNEVAIGDVLRIDEKKLQVDRIKTNKGKLAKEGSSEEAYRIRRAYCKELFDRPRYDRRRHRR